MNRRHLPGFLGLIALCLVSVPALAVEPVAVAPMPLSATPPEIGEFVSSSVAMQECRDLLKKKKYFKSAEKIKALQAYRECRSGAALQQLSVFTWQTAQNEQDYESLGATLR